MAQRAQVLRREATKLLPLQPRAKQRSLVGSVRNPRRRRPPSPRPDLSAQTGRIRPPRTEEERNREERPAEDRDRREGEKKAKKRKKDSDRTRRGNRAGRNHQRLYRALENPDQPLHRKRPASYWDNQHSQGHRAHDRHDRR